MCNHLTLKRSHGWCSGSALEVSRKGTTRTRKKAGPGRRGLGRGGKGIRLIKATNQVLRDLPPMNLSSLLPTKRLGILGPQVERELSDL